MRLKRKSITRALLHCLKWQMSINQEWTWLAVLFMPNSPTLLLCDVSPTQHVHKDSCSRGRRSKQTKALLLANTLIRRNDPWVNAHKESANPPQLCQSFPSRSCFFVHLVPLQSPRHFGHVWLNDILMSHFGKSHHRATHSKNSQKKRAKCSLNVLRTAMDFWPLWLVCVHYLACACVRECRGDLPLLHFRPVTTRTQSCSSLSVFDVVRPTFWF